MMMGHVCQSNGQRLGGKCKSLITRPSLPFWVVFHFWGFCWQLEEIRWSRWWIQICLIFTPIPGVSWSYLQRRILFKRVGGFNHPTSDCWPSLFRHKAEAYGFVLNSSWKEGETCGKKNREEDTYRSQVLAHGDDDSDMPVIALRQLMRERNLPLPSLKASVSACFCLSVARFAEQQCFWSSIDRFCHAIFAERWVQMWHRQFLAYFHRLC